MTVVLLVFLLFAVLQVALYCYARTVVNAASAEAARIAAASGAVPSAGDERAAQVIKDGLGARLGRGLRCAGSRGRDPTSGVSLTTVRCRGYVHALFLPLNVPLRVDITSSVLTEPPS